MARRKTKTRAKRRTGLAAVPLDSFEKCRYHFFEEIDSKDKTKIIKDYIKKSYKKKEVQTLFSLSDDYFRASDVAATIFWLNTGLETNERFEEALNYIRNEYIPKKLQSANYESQINHTPPKKETADREVISVAERLAQKVNDTVLVEIDKLYDAWIKDEEYDIDLYNVFLVNGLKGQATKQVKDWITQDYEQYKAALDKTDDFMVESYSHVPTKEKKKRIKIFETMLQDLERIKHTSIMQRKVRKQTVKSADKQVSKMKYKNADSDFKLQSINPILIVGSHRLYAFNTKYKRLTILKSEVGFEVSGSTIKNFDPTSIEVTLRKPEEILPIILGRADKTIDQTIDALSTKKREANGRINNDTILLRAT